MDKMLNGDIGTSIAPIQAQEEPLNDSNKTLKSLDGWYNLNGQKVSTPTQRGIYIKGGKKRVIK